MDNTDKLIYRFRCSNCGAEKDQEMRRSYTKFIKCICGGDAEKQGNVKHKAELSWWTITFDDNTVMEIGKTVRGRAEEIYANL